MVAKKFQYPIVDVWANPPGAAIPEVARLLAQSHSDPGTTNQKRSPKDVITLMDEAGVSHICMSAWSRAGETIFSNAEVTEYTRAYPDRIFGLAAVDLHDPVSAVKELEHYVKVEGFVGLRVVPWLWNLPPTDAHYWPLFVKCIELDIPFLTQVGHTGPLCPSEVGRPIPYIDAIALKFPDLRIIMGHMGYPWVAETVAVAWKHQNVYIDTSAWSPKYYASELIRFANTTGREKVMFGTNFPQLGWKTCVDNVNEYLVGTKDGFKSKVVQDFMGGNAIRVLKLPSVNLGNLKSNL
ncbi:amidohydrolase 2 [Lindgomyces ingoldianus]|uniref:Amidohydrolase 2 n=1 Tax=Lindgomyces ingoldianus TaxID=673940 RepID=A0ACB6QVG4_9PLEO|nr:amidohydrolase 2 [Lindgomyces ingoldianus]KAF2470926.1 amidohydrolase 2 [Lindgomyces ingoldianus]